MEIMVYLPSHNLYSVAGLKRKLDQVSAFEKEFIGNSKYLIVDTLLKSYSSWHGLWWLCFTLWTCLCTMSIDHLILGLFINNMTRLSYWVPSRNGILIWFSNSTRIFWRWNWILHLFHAEKICSLENKLKSDKEQIRRKDTIISELEVKLEEARMSNKYQPQTEDISIF